MIKRETDAIESIHLSITAISTPSAVFKALTSQTDLRKWWASRVILSRNIVSQEDGREMEMKLVQAEKNHLVRYSWRSVEEADDIVPTIITFEIEDCGVSRGNTGEGIRLHVIHDGWMDIEERNRQENVWKLALSGLKDLLEEKPIHPWWELEKNTGSFKAVKLQTIKLFIEKIDRECRSRADKKMAGSIIGRLCQNLDGQGIWYQKQNGNEIELRFRGYRVFSAMKNGNLAFSWREIEKMAGPRFQDFTQRLSLEQELDLHIGKGQEKISSSSLNPDLLSRWFIDILQNCRDRS